MTRRTIMTLMLLFSVSLSPARDSWSLERCIAYALKHNLEIQKYRLAAEMGKNDLITSKLDFLPSAEASAEQDFRQGASSGPLQSASLHSTLSLLEGMQRIYRVKSSRAELEKREEETEREKNETALKVVTAYLEILLSEELLSTASDNLEAIAEQKKRTGILVEAGRQPYASLLEIDAQLAAEQAALISAEGRYRKQLLKMQQLLDLPYDEEFRIRKINDELPQDFDPDEISQVYLRALNLPGIRAAEAAVRKSQLDLKVIKGRFFPRLSLSGNIWWSRDHTGQPTGSSLEISMQIPIFQRWKTMSETRNAELLVKSAELELETARQKLYKEIQSALMDADLYHLEMAAAEANLKATEESFRHVEEKFNAGLLDITDYLVARTNLLKIRSERLQKKYRFIFQLKILEFYKGRPWT